MAARQLHFAAAHLPAYQTASVTARWMPTPCPQDEDALPKLQPAAVKAVAFL